MKLKDMIVMCLSNLFKRKVRTLLTVMGVVIGTCAIVVMISLGLGMQKTTEEALAQMGDLTVIQIYNWSGSTDIPPLDDSMLKTFKEHQYVEATMPVYQGEWGQYTIKSGKYAYEGMIYGVYMEDLEAFGYQLTEGSFPSAETGGEENYILFGSQAPYDFYNTKKNNNNRVNMIPDAEGNMPDPFVNVMKDKLEIEINKQDPQTNKKKAPVFKIKTAGIMTEDWSKNPSPSYSVFLDMNFLKKLQTEYNKLNNVKVDKNKKDTGYQQVMVKVDDMKHVAEVEEVIKSYGYETNSMESIRKPIEEQARSQQMILGGLGAISLLVAALGITNTMIMSIYERTREIGVMKVLGCMIKNIRTVFLMEAGTIGFIGGVIGVGISYLISFIINSISAGAGGGDIYGMMMGGGGLGGSSIIPFWLVIGAIAFATMIGLISGFYPANRAVKISALTAIKQE